MKPFLKPALLAVGLIAVAFALRALPGNFDRHLAAEGPRGALWFVATSTIACAVGMPRQAVAFAGAYVFGPVIGGALALVAQILGCAVDFVWARAIARDWVLRRLRGRAAAVDRFLAANPFGATLTMRLLPIGNNLVVNLLGGVSSVGAAPFLLASAIGYVPQTVVFALLGSGMQVGRGAQLAVGVGLFAASLALGLVLLRRVRRLSSP